jgi:DNA polymerase III epsilon subunit-like protein
MSQSHASGLLGIPQAYEANLGAAALTISDIGRSLAHTTFVVVDLETAGGKPADAGITEIGAVKVRGGEVIGEFRTFCAPGVPIPAFISVLTGITDHHVAGAPSVASQFVSSWRLPILNLAINRYWLHIMHPLMLVS